MNLLVDMNRSPKWLGVLAAAGIPATHWSTVGRHDAPDVEIMGYARQHGYIVLTHDLDFGAILAATQGRAPSVVQIRAYTLSSRPVSSPMAQVVAPRIRR